MKTRRPEPTDPYLRAVRKLHASHRDRCDCPCHWYRNVREAKPCCQLAGLRYVASQDSYVPFPDPE